MVDKKYAIFIVEGGMGKVIASTAIAEAIKKNHPGRQLVVVTPWPEVYINNPYVFRVYRSGNHPYFYSDYIEGKDVLVFKAEPYFTTGHIHKKQHILTSWCELFNLKYNNERPRLYFTVKELQLGEIAFKRQKPVLALQTNGGLYQQQRSYCWTRDMPYEQAIQLANHFSDKYHVVQITRPNSPKIPNVEILPELPKRELLLFLKFTNKRILIDSCLQHAAAAFDMPSTVLWIGTSHKTFGYSLHKNIYPAAKKKDDELIDGFLYDNSFDGFEHEYPFTTHEIFDLNAVVKTI